MINFDKFLASFITEMKECKMRTFSIPGCIKKALGDQGLEYKDGEIVKTQRRISAEAKENGYDKSKDDEEIVKLADEYYDKVLLKECGMKEKEAHHCRLSYIHGAKAMLKRQKQVQPKQDWRPSEEQMIALDKSSGIVGMFTQKGMNLHSLYQDLKKLTQQKSE